MSVEKNNDLSGKVCGDALTVSALMYLKMINIDPIAIEGKKVFSKIIYRDGVHKELFFSVFTMCFIISFQSHCMPDVPK